MFGQASKGRAEWRCRAGHGARRSRCPYPAASISGGFRMLPLKRNYRTDRRLEPVSPPDVRLVFSNWPSWRDYDDVRTIMRKPRVDPAARATQVLRGVGAASE